MITTFQGEWVDTDGCAYVAQLQHIRDHTGRQTPLPYSRNLCELEDVICAYALDAVTRVRSRQEREYAELADHYAKYVAAFQAMTGDRPRILCVGDSDGSFGAGVEMAGCVAVTATDCPTEWTRGIVQGIHANGATHELATVKRIAHQLQRHSNAFRRWDTLLQLVVHGLNCVEVNQLGCTPFFALFGRDPVGLAELSWPDLEHLDVDGNDFITGLADKLRLTD